MTMVNNFFKEVGHAAIMGGQNHLWAAKNGALLAIAAGIGVAHLTVRSGDVAARNNTIDSIQRWAEISKSATGKMLRVTNMISSPKIAPLHKTTFAIQMASHCFLNANVAETIKSIPNPIDASKTVMQNIIRSSVSTVFAYTCLGALKSGAWGVVEQTTPQRLQSNWLTGGGLQIVTEVVSKELFRKLSKTIGINPVDV